jgi:Flp pilus assembly pilin Flp
MRRIFRKGLAQSTIEYALLVSVITAAVVAMQLYINRSTRASLKVLEEQINAEPQ